MHHNQTKILSTVAILTLLLAICANAMAQGWVNVSYAISGRPPAGNYLMAYDANRNTSVLVGGPGATWTYNGAAWTQASPTPDLPGGPTELTYHGGLGCVVCRIHNGYVSATGRQSISLYKFDGLSWLHVDTFEVGVGMACPPYYCGGPILSGGGMAFDATASHLVMHFSRTRYYCNDPNGCTHSYSQTSVRNSNGAIIAQPLVIPTPGLEVAACYFDSGVGRTVMITKGREVWQFDSANNDWSQHFPILPPNLAKAAYSTHANAAVFLTTETISGQTFPACYKLEGDTCSRLTLTQHPSLREAPICYDEARRKFVIFGGTWAGNNYADTWELSLGPVASYSFYGNGCSGSRGPLSLGVVGQGPAINSLFRVQVNNLPLTGPTFMSLGFSNTTFGTTSLPLNLGFLGAPGCDMLMSHDQLYAIPNVLGAGPWSITIPNLPGTTFYNQAFCLDPSANALGISVSNGLTAVIGI